MSFQEWRRPVWVAVLVMSAATWIACNKSGSKVAASSEGGKVPITTSSEEARKEFLTGRDLSERLLAQESLQHFDKALALDPQFAAAELARANSSPTAKEFFEHLQKAVALAPKASNGERLLIQANEAGANGVTEVQKEYLDQLVAAYPGDERAQFTLGTYYFGQQDFDQAIAHYKKTAELAPSYSPVYNLMGYSYRQKGDFANSEQAFKKYIELIPNDPNPYDSYAEMLLKMGRFDESIAEYRKALSIDPHFNPSHFGISADYMYSGKAKESAAELQTMADGARNDGELRTAYFGMAVLAADAGRFEQAVAAIDKEFAIAEKKTDTMSMAGDLQAKGNILERTQKYDAAAKQFDQALQLVEDSSLSQEIKNNATLQHHFNAAGVAIGKKDLTGAKTHAEEFRKGAEAAKNNGQIKQAHELAGRIALAEKDYGKAIAELEQANLQNPQNLYRLSQAYRGQGDAAKAQEYLKKVVEFNPLPGLNYAFVREKAVKEAGKG